MSGKRTCEVGFPLTSPRGPNRLAMRPGLVAKWVTSNDDRKRFISAHALIDFNYGPLHVYESRRYFDFVCAWRSHLALSRKHVRCARVARVLP